MQTVTKIGSACREIGFLCITGTGIDVERTDSLRKAVIALFDVPDADKQAGAITRDNYRGFIPLGFFTPNDGTGTTDLYEAYKLHWECPAGDPVADRCALYGPNRWPPQIPALRDAVLDYWAALDRINDALLRALAIDLALPEAAFAEAFDKPLTNMTLLHYPPQPAGYDGYGIHPHKDTDALTIIAPDPVGGLEVKTRDGAWITPDCPPGGFIVNIGDMLELWSGGRFVSTPHRVVNRSGRERYSFPWFAVPRHDVVVRPLVEPLTGFNRPPVHCGHWSAEIWRTNWPDEQPVEATPELGTLKD